jgi:hypothetical protein
MGNLDKLEYYKRRYSAAKAKTELWKNTLEKAYHYCIPGRNLFDRTSWSQGEQKNGRVFDTTAIAATRNFVAKIQEALTPPQKVWATLKAGTEYDEDFKDEVNEQLEEINKILFDHIRHSNFDMVMNECYYDLAVGTAILVINEGDDDNPLVFHSIPLARIFFDESATGRLDNCYRYWDEIRVTDIQEMWPNANIPNWMIDGLENNPVFSVKSLYEGVIYFHKEKLYRYCLWTDNSILLEDEHVASPWVAFRWDKVNNEIMGRGPILQALPSILSLNELARVELIAANFNACKPYMAFSDSVFNPWTTKLEPMSIIPVAPGPGGTFPIKAFDDVRNPAFEQFTANDLRQQINKILFADPLGNIEETPTKTATELSLRQRNMLEEMGPTFSRLQQEFLSRVIQRVINILQLKGFLKPLVVDGKEIQIAYQSDLVVSQGRKDVENLLDYSKVMQAMYGPEGMSFLQPAEIPGWVAEKMGIPSSLIVDKSKIEENLGKMASEQEDMQQMALEAQYAR